MHRMTRHMANGVAQAPFDGAEFRMRGDVARMVTEKGQRYMQIRSAKYASAWYRITKVIGGRFREDYAGVRVSGPAASAHATSDERILPVSYLLFDSTWRYKGYSVLSPERDGLRRGLKWKTSCIFCHNTAPWLSLHYDELYGVGAPSYQGAASLKLPNDRHLAYRITDDSAFMQALDTESEFLGGEGIAGADNHELLERASDQTRRLFSEEHLVEVGIGCEACHGGAREHALHPGTVLPNYLPSSGFLATTLPGGERIPKALAMSHSCAKCHTVLFSRYEHTWEGGKRGFSPGGSNMNSGEARNFLLGACTTKLECSSCHDPHAQDDPESLARLDTVAGNPVCTRCHDDFASNSALQRHTRHLPGSSGSACLACHMPKKNVGLAYQLTRYHRIGSPTDRERVEQDRPLECALCHADKSVRELLTQMENLWNKSYDRAKLQGLYGRNLDENILSATLRRGKPHEQVVAIHTIGTAQRGDNLNLLVEQMAHEYPLVRFFARRAIERITGKQLTLDMHATGPTLRASTTRQLNSATDGATTTLPEHKSHAAD
jgi:predicted CXXCH cytochrome family protein